ncbi:MAG: protein kinase, partial [Ignavibacteriales bacterium]|nr:protein kinase [Ignavibacteriales bacterium]
MIGSTISHYKILEKLGEGGMGVVYKAQDTKLDRTVALKFLPPQISGSEQDKARFIQEAKAASAMNHPNVCTIYDIQEYTGADGAAQMFIVMEYVEGQTLDERKKSLSLKQALDIGIQIAEGLAAAHEKGIVHRDVKPENIMVRKDGIVQIMDFGLAKLKGVSKLTKEGSTVGTAGYMSPEQVQGLDVDHRSDIFSLGVLLYELFTGQLPFKGVHETAISYEIVNVDSTPMSAIKPDLDPALDAIVLECLEKDPNERTQSAKQAAIDLKRFKRESSKQRVSRVTRAYQTPPSGVSPSVAPPKPTLIPKLISSPWILAAAFLIVLSVVGIVLLRSTPSPDLLYSSILPPKNAEFVFYGPGAGPVVISPDGKRLAFVASSPDKKARIWIRPLDSPVATQLEGTEGARYPFWSPDNQWLGYFSGTALMKVNVAGGPPTMIAPAGNGRGGSWNSDGIIAFSPGAGSPINTVSADGGTPVAVTALDASRREQTHRWPYFLPGGNHFLYYARTAVVGTQGEADVVYVTSLDSKVNKTLMRSSANAAYAAGYVLFMRGSTLMAQRFNEDALELEGEPVPLAEGVLNDAGYNLAVFSVSQNGVLAYQHGKAQAGSRLVILDRSGKNLGVVGGVTEFYTPRISPDGKRVAVGTFDAQSRNQDIWVYDIERSVHSRFTFDLATEFYAIWSHDGKEIVFNSDRNGKSNLYRKSSTGGNTEQPLFESPLFTLPDDWSADGRFLSMTQGDS